jgi:hypothetical protein
MIQWFRGRIEACYVGTPISAATLQRPGAEHFKPLLYRALVRDVVPIPAPEPGASPIDAASPAASGPATAGFSSRAEPRASTSAFRAARIDSSVVAGVRGPGSSYEGPVFDVHITDSAWSRGVRKDGKSYGIVTGQVIAYCELPPPPPPPEVALKVSEPAPAERLSAELQQPSAARAAPNTKDGAARATEAATPANGASTALADEDDADAELAPEPAPARAKPEREDSAALPLFSVAAAIAIALWVSCGGAPALLWSVFLLPTLIARKLFHGVLRDSDGIRGFGIALILIQLFCTSTLVSGWWGEACRPLSLLPLIGIVAVIFPSGLLPSALALCLNAAGLALVLGLWCGGGEHCPGTPPAPPAAPSRAPSVEHPGVPRTNPDGSWPRRPPG